MSAETVTPLVRLDLDEGYRFRVSFDREVPGLMTDEPPPLGSDRGPNPLMMLGAAIGDCLATSLLYCVRKAHIDPSGVHADVRVVTERNDAGRLRVKRVDVSLAPEMTDEERSRLQRCATLFESFCTVTESVRSGFPVNVTLTPVVPAREEWPERLESTTPPSPGRLSPAAAGDGA